MYEWNIEINDIKRIEIVDTPIGDGVNGSEITFAFRENYFQKNDTFEIEETRQQFFVTAGPTRQNDQYWVIQARIIDGDFNTVLDDSISYVGGFAKWIGNAFPELHEYGMLILLFSA